MRSFRTTRRLGPADRWEGTARKGALGEPLGASPGLDRLADRAARCHRPDHAMLRWGGPGEAAARAVMGTSRTLATK